MHGFEPRRAHENLEPRPWRRHRVDLAAVELDRDDGCLLRSPNRSRLLPTSITFLRGRTLAIARFGWGGGGGGGRRLGHVRVVPSRPPTPTLPHKGGGRRKRHLIEIGADRRLHGV